MTFELFFLLGHSVFKRLLYLLWNSQLHTYTLEDSITPKLFQNTINFTLKHNTQIYCVQ